MIDQVLFYADKLKKYVSIRDLEKAEDCACSISKNIFEKCPNLGIDLDGTIDEAPEFFRMLSKVWPGRVYIITFRADRDKALERAKSFGVYFDDLVTVGSLDGKAEVIKSLDISVYVDDQDECLANIPDDVTVLKIRNGGNFENSKWLYSSITGREI